MTRIGRGHLNARDVNVRREVRELARRSQRSRDYGNPYISISDDLLRAEDLDRAAAKSQGIHRRMGQGPDPILDKKYCMRSITPPLVGMTAHVALRRQSQIGTTRLYGSRQRQYCDRRIANDMCLENS